MPRVGFDDEALADLERILTHLITHGGEDAGERVADVMSATAILQRHPHIGRPVEDGLRELVIGRGSRGYVARYRVLDEDDLVLVLAVRGQRERGFEGRRG